MIGAVELVANKEAKESFDPTKTVGAQVVAEAQKNSVIRAMPGDAIAFSPPLIITEEEIDMMVDRFGTALETVAATL